MDREQRSRIGSRSELRRPDTQAIVYERRVREAARAPFVEVQLVQPGAEPRVEARASGSTTITVLKTHNLRPCAFALRNYLCCWNRPSPNLCCKKLFFLQFFIHTGEGLQNSRTSSKRQAAQLCWTLISLDALKVHIHTGWYVGSTQESETESDQAARS
jgi:hypothetical protein